MFINIFIDLSWSLTYMIFITTSTWDCIYTSFKFDMILVLLMLCFRSVCNCFVSRFRFFLQWYVEMNYLVKWYIYVVDYYCKNYYWNCWCSFFICEFKKIFIYACCIKNLGYWSCSKNHFFFFFFTLEPLKFIVSNF